MQVESVGVQEARSSVGGPAVQHADQKVRLAAQGPGRLAARAGV